MSSEDSDDLTRALRARSRDAVDSEVVLGRVMAGVERRRRARQLAGLGATTLAVTGLVVGVQLVLPLGTTAPQDVPVTALPASSGPAPAPTPPVAACDPPGGAGHLERLLSGYFAAGYDAEDADALARVWQMDYYDAKVVAGQRLQDGVALPASDAPAAAVPLGDEARLALGDSGVEAEDVAELSRLWQSDDPELVGLVAGVRLLDGGAPPCL